MGAGAGTGGLGPIQAKGLKLDRCEVEPAVVSLSDLLTNEILAVAFARRQLTTRLVRMQRFRLGLHLAKHSPRIPLHQAVIDDIEQHLAT